MHSPEFLRATNAAYDAAHPARNIIGITKQEHERVAREVLALFPKAPYELVCSVREAELIKYAGNFFLYLKVLFANIVFDLAGAEGAEYEVIRRAVSADPRIGPSHLAVSHVSGHKGSKEGRGAGGLCFIKDIAALRALYEEKLPHDTEGIRMLRALECKNSALLMASEKDVDLVKGVYGDAPEEAKRELLK